MKVWQIVLLSLLAVVLSFVLVAWSAGLELFGLKFAKPIENAKTEVTRSTNQYITTQQQMLNQYATQYRAAEGDGSKGQMRAILNQMKDIAVTLKPEDIPSEAAAILSENGF